MVPVENKLVNTTLKRVQFSRISEWKKWAVIVILTCEMNYLQILLIPYPV